MATKDRQRKLLDLMHELSLLVILMLANIHILLNISFSHEKKNLCDFNFSTNFTQFKEIKFINL